jgi:hypothetical protein
MPRRPRRNHRPAFKAKLAIAAITSSAHGAREMGCLKKRLDIDRLPRAKTACVSERTIGLVVHRGVPWSRFAILLYL